MATLQKKSHPALTPQRVAKLKELGKRIDHDEGEQIRAKGRAFFARQETIVKLIATLKAARVAQGLTLDAIGAKSGIGKTNVSRLENDDNPNPTWDTLARYAEAVGKRLDPALA